jgi:hypothetical protein
VTVRTAAAVILVGLAGLAGCNDVRDFAGTWTGHRVQGLPSPPIGAGTDDARLTIDSIDTHGLRGSLRVTAETSGGPTLVDSTFSSLEPAEADVLASMTFSGDPLRVYLAFVPTAIGAGGDALAVISLYDSRRVELRLIKGAPDPAYAIFALEQP